MRFAFYSDPTLTYQNPENQTRYFVFVESMPTFNGQDVNQGHGFIPKAIY